MWKNEFYDLDWKVGGNMEKRIMFFGAFSCFTQ
jgi:hypothetical protein